MNDQMYFMQEIRKKFNTGVLTFDK